jgi:hypothetical protein
MARPNPRQFGELAAADFERHPVGSVRMRSQRAVCILSCNEGEEGCTTLELDTNYALESVDPLYKCENVGLAIPKTVDKYKGVYCLQSVIPHQNSQ